MVWSELTALVNADWNSGGMLNNRRHRPSRRDSGKTNDSVVEKMRQGIATNLGIDVARIQYGNLGRQGKLGTTDPHWLIYYRDEWRELPWHFDGPLLVTREMLRAWYGVPKT